MALPESMTWDFSPKELSPGSHVQQAQAESARISQGPLRKEGFIIKDSPTADMKTRHPKAPVALEGRGLRKDFTQPEQFLWRPSTLPLRAGRMLKDSVCFKATFSNVLAFWLSVLGDRL